MMRMLQKYKTLTNFTVGLLISMLSAPLQAAPDGNFGRLFSKPNERNNLNVLRQNQKLKTIIAQETEQPEQVAEPAKIELPAPVTMQGYVKRSDGTSTLWINNQAMQENSTVDNVKIGQLNQRGYSKNGANTEGIDIKIPANGKRVRLKAGQMYEPENNKVYEMQ
ncbi:MAG: hypothetical protein ABL920_06715, partial [Methylotenera sp.]